ncbi:MAG: 4-hydroxy-tetrahydrodipicolinate synthase [Campylobacterales bacterium]
MLTGAMTALITPFKNDKVDYETYEKLIKRQINNGIDVVVPVGTTGESATLTHDEHRECIEVAASACKGTNAKVLAGAGSNATAEAIGLAKFAQKAGADGILCVTPYYNKPTQEGLFQHYKAIAASVDLPVMLYNVPGRTGVDLKPETVFRLFDEVRTIFGIKEASGSMERVVALSMGRPDLVIVSGEDAITFPIMANGGQGNISVTANLLPDQVSDSIHAAMKGDYAEAKTIADRLYPINKALFLESNPIPIKAAMYLAGLLDTLEYRLPLVAPSSETMGELENLLKIYEVKGL